MKIDVNGNPVYDLTNPVDFLTAATDELVPAHLDSDARLDKTLEIHSELRKLNPHLAVAEDVAIDKLCREADEEYKNNPQFRAEVDETSARMWPRFCEERDRHLKNR